MLGDFAHHWINPLRLVFYHYKALGGYFFYKSTNVGANYFDASEGCFYDLSQFFEIVFCSVSILGNFA